MRSGSIDWHRPGALVSCRVLSQHAESCCVSELKCCLCCAAIQDNSSIDELQVIVCDQSAARMIGFCGVRVSCMPLNAGAGVSLFDGVLVDASGSDVVDFAA